MKYKYKSLLFVVFGLIAITATAQKDTLLNRQVMLERDYTPTMQSASRISTNPSIYEHTVKRSEVSFINQAPVLAFPHKELGKVGAGDIGTELPISTKRGYFQLGAGTKSNIQGATGYRLVDKANDQLDIYATYYATDGNVKYADKGYLTDEMKAKYSDIKAKIKYQHTFKPSIFSIYAGYGNTGYNYYGNSFIPSIAQNVKAYDFDTKQTVDVFSIGAGLKSSNINGGPLKYDGNVSYDNFKNKHGLIKTDEGMKGGIINANADVYTEFGTDNFVGLRGGVLNQAFNNSAQHLKDTLHSYTNINANPYYRVEGNNWATELGFGLNTLFDNENKFFVHPNLKAHVHISEINTLYAAITGGVNNNTFLDILQENRYASPLGRVKYSRTQYDVQLGFKSGSIKGLEFNIFAGYKNTKDDHLYIASPMVTLADSRWGNVSIPAYATVSAGHVGLLVKTHLIPYTTLSAKGVGYFYSVKDLTFADMESYDITDEKAWGRPSFTAELNADIKPFKKLVLSGNYLLSSGRKAFAKGETVSMKSISELNVRAAYQITDWFTVDARANNVLNQKYDYVYGYTVQGLNVLGGLNFKF